MGEAMRFALNSLAVVASEWLMSYKWLNYCFSCTLRVSFLQEAMQSFFVIGDHSNEKEEENTQFLKLPTALLAVLTPGFGRLRI